MNLLDRLKAVARPSIPPVWAVATGLLVALWIAWIAYSAAERGTDAGVGVLVAWPALLAMAAIVALPFAVIAVLIVRIARGGRRGFDAADGAAAEEDENATGATFPM